MSYYRQPPPPDKDPQLWYIAQKRASFKYHLATYVVINAFFWVIWYFNGQHGSHSVWPWPVWPMLGGVSGFSFTGWELMFCQKKILWKENMIN